MSAESLWARGWRPGHFRAAFLFCLQQVSREEASYCVLTRITLNSGCHLLCDMMAAHMDKLLLKFHLQSFANACNANVIFRVKTSSCQSIQLYSLLYSGSLYLQSV